MFIDGPSLMNLVHDRHWLHLLAARASVPVLLYYANFLLELIVHRFDDPRVALVLFPLLQSFAWLQTLLHSVVYSIVRSQLIARKVNSFSENISPLNFTIEILHEVLITTETWTRLQDTARHSGIYMFTSYAHFHCKSSKVLLLVSFFLQNFFQMLQSLCIIGMCANSQEF